MKKLKKYGEKLDIKDGKGCERMEVEKEWWMGDMLGLRKSDGWVNVGIEKEWWIGDMLGLINKM